MPDQNFPSVSEIRAATERLSSHDASNKVVRIGDMAIKFGHHTDLIEATNLRFLAENSDIPVPKVFASFVDEATREKFIIMEYFPGSPLNTLWPDLTDSEKRDIEIQIKVMIKKLRSIKEPGYFGTPDRGHLTDGTIWDPVKGFDPSEAGPFDSEEQLHEAMIRRLSTLVDPPYTSFLPVYHQEYLMMQHIRNILFY